MGPHFWPHAPQLDLAARAEMWRNGYTRTSGCSTFPEAYRTATARGMQPEPWVLVGLGAPELAECLRDDDAGER